MSRQAKTTKDHRARFKRSRQNAAQVQRYLQGCEITLKPNLPTSRSALVEALERQIAAGGATKVHPFCRHHYTNYDDICDYAHARWQAPVYAEFKHRILHPKVRRVVNPWLRSIGAEDLLTHPLYGIAMKPQRILSQNFI